MTQCVNSAVHNEKVRPLRPQLFVELKLNTMFVCVTSRKEKEVRDLGVERQIGSLTALYYCRFAMALCADIFFLFCFVSPSWDTSGSDMGPLPLIQTIMLPRFIKFI